MSEERRITLHQTGNTGDITGIHNGDKITNNIITRADTTLKDLAENAHLDIKVERTQGTCDWLLQRSEFRTCIGTESHAFLWLYGVPGCGKSTLMSSIIEHIRKQSTAEGFHLWFFYVDYKNKQQKPYSSMMATFLQQAEGNTICADAIDLTDDTDEERLDRIVEKDGRHIYMVIDAVDQLPRKDRLLLLDQLNTLVRKRRGGKTGHRLAVIISSRTRDGCNQLRNQNLCEVQVRPSDNEGDIRIYLEKALRSDLFSENTHLKKEVLYNVASKSNGMFLWAKLQAQIICDMELEEDVIGALDENIKPTEMDQVYERYAIAFEALRGKEKDVAQRTMALLGHTTGSISKEVLLEALDINTCMKKEGQRSVTGVNLREKLHTVARICRYLVEIDPKQGVFRFCHASAFEFFRDYKSAQTHKLILQVCLAYLSSPVFSQGYYRDAKWSNYGSLGPVLGKYPFLKFASYNWANSLKKSYGVANGKTRDNNEVDEEMLDHLDNFFGVSGEKKNPHLAFQVYMLSLRNEIPGGIGNGIPGGISHEHIISYLGLVNLFDILKERKWLNLQKVDDEGLSAIHWAIRRVSNQETELDVMNDEICSVVEKLIEYQVDIDASDENGRTALHYAAHYGHVQVVRLLVERKARLNMKDEQNRTALIEACQKHHEEIVSTLIAAGADLWIQSSCGTALQVLCLGGCCKCVKSILDQDEKKDRLRRLRPLAARSSIAKSLLSRYYMRRFGEGSGTFGTSLHAAAFHGRRDVVEFLLNQAVFRVGATHHIYGSVLTAAAAGCNMIMNPEPFEEIVSRLIAHGVDVNDRGGTRGPALLAAASNGHKSLVELLLNKGASIRSANSPLGTAYQAARESHHEEVMELLLKRDVNAAAYSIDSSRDTSLSGISNLQQEFFKVIFTVSNQGNIGSWIHKAETFIGNEIEKGKPTAKLSLMVSACIEIFENTAELATNTKQEEEEEEGEEEEAQERKMKKRVKTMAAAREDCVSSLLGLFSSSRRHHHHQHHQMDSLDEIEAAKHRSASEPSPSRVQRDSSSSTTEPESLYKPPGFKLPYLQKRLPLSRTDFDFAGALDLMTQAAVNMLHKAIEVKSPELRHQIAHAWVEVLNKIMYNNINGRSLVTRLVRNRAMELRGCWMDPKLTEKERLDRSAALFWVGVELILVTFREGDRYKDLSLILCNLCIAAVNDVEDDLGEQGNKAVRKMLQIVVEVFSDAMASGDQHEIEVCAAVGIQILKQSALSPKKNLLESCGDEWARQWDLATRSGITDVISKIVDNRWQEDQKSFEEKDYDKLLSYLIGLLVVLKASFEQELNTVIDAIVPILEKGFHGMITKFSNTFTTPKTAGKERDLSQTPDEQFSGQRRHLYESIVEATSRLFAAVEERASNKLKPLALITATGIHKLPVWVREMLEEVMLQRIEVAETGSDLQRREIDLTLHYFLDAVNAAEGLEAEARKLCCSWIEGLTTSCTWQWKEME